MSPEKVVLVGPASPRDVAELLSGGDSVRAGDVQGYRGIPVTELAKALVDAGLQVEIVTTAMEVERRIELEGPRFRLVVVPMRRRARVRALSAFRRERQQLVRAIAASSAPVVHAHWTYEFAWAALDSGRPALVTAHDAPLTILGHYRDAYRAIRTAMAYVTRLRVGALTAVSPYLAERWRRQMAYRRQIAVVPNIAPALPPAHGRRNGCVRLVDVADGGRAKNVVALVRAFRLLRQADDSLRLDLVGRGLEPSGVFAGAMTDEGPCEGIVFHGQLDRRAIADVLAAAHVFVHPSREECCSTAVLEAMRAQVPVVAGREAGGTPWMLDQGRAGMLADVERPEEIAGAVAQLLADSQLAQEFVGRASERVESTFSRSAVASAYVDLYEHVLRRAG